MKNLFLFISVVFGITACQKYIDIYIPDHGRKIVLNCLYSDTALFHIQLSLSKHILDNSHTYMPISGATIEIYQNDTLKELCTEYDVGLYRTQWLRPSAGQKHKIIVRYQDQIIEAQSYLPEKNAKMIFLDSMLIKQEYSYSLRLKFRIISNALNQYFLIHFPAAMHNGHYSEQTFLYFQTSDPLLETNNGYAAIFTNESFPGSSRTISVDLDAYAFSGDSTYILYFELLTLSKDAYYYLRSVMKQQTASISPFAEPVIVYSNIQNGYGIFGGYTIYRDSIYITGFSLPNTIYE